MNGKNTSGTKYFQICSTPLWPHCVGGASQAISLILVLLCVTSKTAHPSFKGTSSLLGNLRQSWSSQVTSITPHTSLSCHLNTQTHTHTGSWMQNPLVSWILMHSGYTNVNALLYQCTSKRLRLNIYVYASSMCGIQSACVYIYLYTYIWNVYVAKSCRITVRVCVCVYFLQLLL